LIDRALISLSDFPFILPARFRWLFAVLVALSLIAPHSIWSESPSVSPEVVGTFTPVADFHAEDGVFEAFPAGEGATDPPECDDTHSGDYPYEMDQIFSLFPPHRGADTAQWGGVYCAHVSSDPIFPIDRPPKTTPRGLDSRMAAA
jgi:hypothetical protein